MRRPIKMLIILLILVGVYLLLPFGFGFATQRYASRFLNNENQTLGKVMGIHLNFAQYNRGWFRSTAALQIERKASDGNYEIIKTVPVVIKHGPSFRIGERYAVGLGRISNVEIKLDQIPYMFVLSDTIHFNGQSAAFSFFPIPNTSDTALASNRFKTDLLTLNVTSDLEAKHFLFELLGRDLGYQDPQDSLAISVKNLNAFMAANYVGERHWQLIFSFWLKKNQFTAMVPDGAPMSATLNLDQLELNRLHFDTQEMAQLLGELVQIKQASDAGKAVKPSAWMALIQQFLTRVIHKDTTAVIKGLSVTTPTGELQGQYDVSFPTLPSQHDYFDIATRNVGKLALNIPNWKYVDTDSNTQLTLNNLHYSDDNNTVFSRRANLSVGAFDVTNLQSTSKAPTLLLAGLNYEGELFGDTKALSQTMTWRLGKFCYTDDCFHQIKGRLELQNMNFDAFRGIAQATQQVVQHDPSQQESTTALWMDLVNAYLKLITPETHVILTHDMMTSAGRAEIHGQLSWPALSEQGAASPTIASYLSQAEYQLHLLIPAAYVDTFLNEQQPFASSTPASTSTATSSGTQTTQAVVSQEPSFVIQAAQFVQYAIGQGYLKKVGGAYTVDLTGKGSVVTINGVPWKTP